MECDRAEFGLVQGTKVHPVCTHMTHTCMYQICDYATDNATITLSGQGTSIQGNVTKGKSYSYGLDAYLYDSKIQLVAPLTKEQISTDNSGGGNWGGDSIIEQIETQTNTCKLKREKGAVCW